MLWIFHFLMNFIQEGRDRREEMVKGFSLQIIEPQNTGSLKVSRNKLKKERQHIAKEEIKINIEETIGKIVEV